MACHSSDAGTSRSLPSTGSVSQLKPLACVSDRVNAPPRTSRWRWKLRAMVYSLHLLTESALKKVVKSWVPCGPRSQESPSARVTAEVDLWSSVGCWRNCVASSRSMLASLCLIMSLPSLSRHTP